MSSIILPARSRHALALREPNLLVPGKKPSGKVEIDWSHWMINPPTDQGSVTSYGGLKSVWLFKPGCKDLNPNGIGTSGYTLISDQGGNQAEWGVGSPGEFIDCDDSGQCINFNTDYTIVNETASNAAHTISFLVDFPLTNGTLNGLVNDNLILNNSTSQITYAGFTATASPALSTLTGPHRITCAIWKDASTEGSRIYVDGILQGSNASNVLPSGIILKGFGNLNIPLNRDRGSRLYDFFLWEGRALDGASIAKHAADPYSLLVAANQTPYLVGVDAGGGAPTLSDISAESITSASVTPRITVTF